MKFRCERDVLAEALATATRAATGRSGALPVLTGLKLVVTGDELVITGTDLDLTIELRIEVGGVHDGATVLPAKLASDIVRSFPSGKVEVALGDDAVRISGGRSEFTVRPMSPDDFPKAVAPTGSIATLPAAEFGEALRQVVRAASTDDSRPQLTGVLLVATDTGVRLVATDSYRLAVRDLDAPHGLVGEQKVLIPGRALSELQRLVGGGGEVRMCLGEREASFEVGSTHLFTRLLDGEFPAYAQLINRDAPNTMTIERDRLVEAIRRVKILARDSIPVRLSVADGTLRVSVVTQDVGDANEELEASLVGDEMMIAFNPDYLIGGLEACATDSVTVQMQDNQHPAILRGLDDTSYLYLLMPVRVS